MSVPRGRKQVEQVMPVGQEARIFPGAELMPRPRQVDLHDVADPAGPAFHGNHPVAEIDRLLQIMGDENHGGAALRRQPRHLVLQVLPGHGVERAERLVHQQHVRLLGQAAGDLQALLHAAGQLQRKRIMPVAESDLLQQPGDDGRTLRPRHSACLKRQRHIVRHRAPWQQRAAIILEHHSELLMRFGHRRAVEGDLAFGGPQQAGQ